MVDWFPVNEQDMSDHFFAAQYSEIALTWHKVICSIPRATELLKEREWFKQNIRGRWYYHFTKEGLHIFFEDPDDAFKFKLTF